MSRHVVCHDYRGIPRPSVKHTQHVKHAHARRSGHTCPQEKFAFLRLNVEAVLTENYEAVNAVLAN